MNRAIFFDRDGVLNELVPRDGGYFSPQSKGQFVIKKNVNKIIKKLKNDGFITIVVSNQPDVSRGLLSEHELDKMTKKLFHELMIDDIYYCIHDDGDCCECRKPKPGLIFQAAKKWNIELRKSYMIGDTWKDAEAAKNANLNFFLLGKDYNLNYSTDTRIKKIKDIFQIMNK